MSKGNKEYLFVDGYNIINAWDELKSQSGLSLEVAREKLIDIMVEYQSCSGVKVIIVFDAHMVKGNSGKHEKRKGVEVVYTRESETADHYIERRLDDIGRKEVVRVATSDWMEQQIVLGRGGTRISARELKIEVDRYLNSVKKKTSVDNSKNDMLIGRLDEETIRKLCNWKKKGLD